MSATDHTEASKAVDAARDAFVEQFVSTYGDAMGHALEMFTRTSAFAGALHNVFENTNAAAQAKEFGMHIAITHCRYLLDNALNSLRLTDEQIETAAKASDELLEKMRAAYESAPSIVLQ